MLDMDILCCMHLSMLRNILMFMQEDYHVCTMPSGED